MPKKNLTALFLLLLCFAGRAQNFPSDSTLTRIFQTDALLPLLIDSAIKNSPEILRGEKNIVLFEQNLQTSKRSILNSISLTSNYGYGNTGSVSYEKDLNVLNQGSFFSNVRSSRYNVGVALQLPLGAFLSRKNTTRAAEVQIGMAEAEKASTELYVKQEVIKKYEDVKLAHTLLSSGAKIKQASSLNLDMAQKNFMNGQITLDQLTTLQNSYNNALMEYDKKVSQFQTSFLILEAYTGVKLTKLINRIR